jgi:hypothetical protein
VLIHFLLEVIVACSVTLNQPISVPTGWVLSSADFIGKVKACTLNENVLRCQGDYKAEHKGDFSKIWLKRTIDDGELAKLPIGCREVRPGGPGTP